MPRLRPQPPTLPAPAKEWWFVVGRNPKLSLAELTSLLKDEAVHEDGPFVTASFSKPPLFLPTELMSQLGGTIKIAEIRAKELSEDDLLTTITSTLQTQDGKIIFGLSLYEENGEPRPGTLDLLERWGKAIKEKLKATHPSVRYVASREATLSSASVEKNNLVTKGAEFLILAQANGTFSLGQTLAVQPFEAWGARDFGRPGRDDVSGMLPPKLALMLINLAGTEKSETLLDPFCGSGTILTEALLLGFTSIVGSDISDKAVEDSQKNIAWQQSKLATPAKVKIFQSDAKELGMKLPSQSIDIIATEPYLGKPLRGNEQRSFLETQIKELKKIYLEAFTAFAKIMKPGGTIVFVIPCFKYKNDWLRIDCVKEIKKIGFETKPLTNEQEYILYARPKQFVGREIWKFKKS